MKLIINIDVDDLDKAIAFYSDGLGLTLGRRLFEGAVAEMNGAPVPIQLLSKAADGLRTYQRHWTPLHLDLEVDDVGTSVQRALQAGAKLEGGIRTFSWGAIATMSDPFGHGFCLLQLIGGGYDQVAVPT